MRVVSASYVSYAFSQLDYSMVQRLGDAGILLVAAAGNGACSANPARSCACVLGWEALGLDSPRPDSAAAPGLR